MSRSSGSTTIFPFVSFWILAFSSLTIILVISPVEINLFKLTAFSSYFLSFLLNSFSNSSKSKYLSSFFISFKTSRYVKILSVFSNSLITVALFFTKVSSRLFLLILLLNPIFSNSFSISLIFSSLQIIACLKGLSTVTL